MFEPIIVHKEESKEIDLSLKLSLYEIKANDVIPPPEIALSVGGATIGTLGNILSIIGKARQFKYQLILPIYLYTCWGKRAR